MNVQRLFGCGWAITLIAVTSQAAIATDGRPTSATLSEMGLGGLTVVSDEAALSIRGQGYRGGSSVQIFGNSFATINTRKGSAHSENGYVASGKHFAAGGNFSFAGATFKSSKGKGGHSGYGMPSHNSRGGHTTIKSIKVFAGGHSWAKAF